VCDAAQATTAAPTYFPLVHVAGHYYVDGGMEYNNPSQAIFDHYDQARRVRVSRIGSITGAQPSSAAHHGDLDSSRVRYVNIGTGTRTEEQPERKRDVVASFVPLWLRTAIHLRETLTQIAVDAEKTAETMRLVERISHGMVRYHRFSADTGVCYFKLDRWAELENIESLTKEYLEKDHVQTKLKEVAEEIANDYLQGRFVTPATPPTSAHAPVTESNLPNPQTPTPAHAPVTESNLPNPQTPTPAHAPVTESDLPNPQTPASAHSPVTESDLTNPQTPFETNDTAEPTRPPLESGLLAQSGSSAPPTITSSVQSPNLLGTTPDRSLSEKSSPPTETDADGPFPANDCQADKASLDMSDALQAGSSAVVAVKG
jgi:hypothetical protein